MALTPTPTAAPRAAPERPEGRPQRPRPGLRLQCCLFPGRISKAAPHDMVTAAVTSQRGPCTAASEETSRVAPGGRSGGEKAPPEVCGSPPAAPGRSGLCTYYLELWQLVRVPVQVTGRGRCALSLGWPGAGWRRRWYRAHLAVPAGLAPSAGAARRVACRCPSGLWP